MGWLSWLFPDVEMKRREALARLDADSRHMARMDEARKPMREVHEKLVPLIGKPGAKRIELSADDYDKYVGSASAYAIEAGSYEIAARIVLGESFTLFGFPVTRGEQTRVLT